MRRRWRVPPPPNRELDAADGAAVLSEDVEGLGVLLWDVARDVVLWAGSPHGELDALFAPSQERVRLAALLTTPTDPLLETALSLLAQMVGEPQVVSGERVALACHMISRWTDNHGAVATAFVFAHAAGVVCPGNPQYAYQAGRLARRRADYSRAEGWLVRAVLLGRQLGDWQVCVNARGGLGNLNIQRGNYPRAEKHHQRALAMSRRHGLRELQGIALHGLCGIAIERGRISDVNSLARQAYDALGNGHPRLPTLAHDVAYAWMEQGYFAPALEVFDAARPHFKRNQYVLVLADICRAAAGIADRERFESAWSETEGWIKSEATQDNVPQALLDLARGAALLGYWSRAENAARRSLELATLRQEARVKITAEAVLESIRREQTAQKTVVEHSARTTEEVDALAGDFVESLTATVHAAAGI